LDDIARAMRDIGRLSGNTNRAEGAARAFEQALVTPCARLSLQPAYVTVWERPAMTVGGRHWINGVLRRAGYRNVFAGLDRGVFHVAPEAAYAYRSLPDISLTQGFERDPADRLADLLSRPGPRLGEAVQILCARRLSQASTGSR
jgi:iron complex transport system substrate-binding protein